MALKNYLLYIGLLLVLHTNAQRGLLFVQKNKKTVHTYSTTSYITMQHQYGYYIQGILASIKKDSFSIYNYVTRPSKTKFGLNLIDTVFTGFTFYSIKDIKSIAIKKNKSIFATLEGLSYLGSIGITLVNVVNGIKFKDTGETILKNTVIQGGGMFVLAKIFGKLHKESYPIGKKYKIVLMPF